MFTVAAQGAPASAAAAGVITGTVTGTGGVPLSSISVMLLKDEGYANASTVQTDASGKYSIDLAQLEAGNYTLWAADFTYQYVGEYWDDTVSFEDATYFSLTSTSSVSAKNFVLVAGAHITGTVTSAADSSQLSQVSVLLLSAESGDVVRSAYISNGSFDLGGIPSGSYKLYFNPVFSGQPTASAGQYWNGATTWASAQTISIKAGETKSGHNAALVRGAMLSGRVTSETTGAPIEGVEVVLTDSHGLSMGYGLERTDANGYYAFQQMLRADSYTLKFGSDTSYVQDSARGFVSEYWENQQFESRSTPVVVAGTTAVVKNAQLVLGGSISGTVDLSAVVDPQFRGESTAYAFDSNTGKWVRQSASTTADDGTYSIPGLAAGTYRVGFEAYSSGTSLGTTFFDGSDTVEDATNVTVTGTGNTPNVDIVLDGDVIRLDGADRFDASASISKRNFIPGVEVAYVANGLNFPDALSGAPAAARASAPILLTLAGEIPPSIKAELQRLRPKQIIVLGGINSVSEAVKTQLGAYATSGTVSRLAGADRFAASAAISAGSAPVGIATVYVANGLNFPDALAGAPVASKAGSPILLVTPTTIPGTIEAELKRLKPGRIVVLGGVNSVSEAVKTQLGALTAGAVTRLAGADRFSASADISAKNFAANADVVYITNGLNFPDALSGAPVAGRDSAPILLVAPNSLPASIAAELTRLKPAKIVILGGVNSVNPSVAAQLQDYIVTPAP